MLPAFDPFAVVGVARSEMSNDAFRKEMREALDKFATTPGVRQVYDNGAVAIYDVRGLLHV